MWVGSKLRPICSFWAHVGSAETSVTSELSSACLALKFDDANDPPSGNSGGGFWGSFFDEGPSGEPSPAEPWIDRLGEVLDGDAFDLRPRIDKHRDRLCFAVHPERVFEAASSLLLLWQAAGQVHDPLVDGLEPSADQIDVAVTRAIRRLVAEDADPHAVGFASDEELRRAGAQMVEHLPVAPADGHGFLTRFNRLDITIRRWLYPMLFLGWSMEKSAKLAGMTAAELTEEFKDQYGRLLRPGGKS